MNKKALTISICFLLLLLFVVIVLPALIGYLADYVLNLNVDKCNDSYFYCWWSGIGHFLFYLFQVCMQLIPITLVGTICFLILSIFPMITYFIVKKLCLCRKSYVKIENDNDKKSVSPTLIVVHIIGYISITVALASGIFINMIAGAIYQSYMQDSRDYPRCNFDSYKKVVNDTCYLYGMIVGMFEYFAALVIMIIVICVVWLYHFVVKSMEKTKDRNLIKYIIQLNFPPVINCTFHHVIYHIAPCVVFYVDDGYVLYSDNDHKRNP